MLLNGVPCRSKLERPVSRGEQARGDARSAGSGQVGSAQHDVVEGRITPPRPRRLVSRPRLSALLSGATRARLTLVTGPAGTGKTTAVSDWVEQLGCPVAWLTVHPDDNDPQTFRRDVMSALERAAPPRATAADEVVPLSTGDLVAAVAARLGASEGHVVLVLDDLHVVRNRAVARQLEALVERQLPGLSIVVVTRSDPQLPLARWRVRDSVCEIRHRELGFTVDEARSYLAGFPELELDDASVRLLTERTEGWIAGLQLAAVSLRHADEPGAFIERFRGTDRYIADFLLDEVLAHQTRSVRDFLVDTSVLDRFDQGLCNALTGRDDAQFQLRRLEASSLFIVRLDPEGRWFRYHTLFRDLLRCELEQRHAERAPLLHRRAAARLMESGDLVGGVEHLLAAGDADAAFSVVVGAGADPETTRPWVREVLDAFPPAFVAADAERMLVVSDMLRDLGRLDDSAMWLERAAAGSTPGEAMVGRAAVTSSWAKWHHAAGDAHAAIERGEPLLDDLGNRAQHDERFLRGLGLDLARAWLLVDDVGAARRAITVELEGDLLDPAGIELAVPALQARIAAREGRLRVAEETAERVLRTADSLHVDRHPAVLDALLARARVHRERDDAAAAAEDLDRLLTLAGRRRSLPYTVSGRAERALIVATESGPDAALEQLLAFRDALASPLPPTLAHVLDVVEAGLSIRAGELERAAHIATRSQPGLDRELLLAAVEYRAGTHALARDRLRNVGAVHLSDRIRVQLMIGVCSDDADELAHRVRAAVRLAAPEGFRRVFADLADPGVARALRSLATSAEAAAHTTRLVDRFPWWSPVTTDVAMVEPLSEREQLVVRYLPTELSHPEIASELVISINTLKTHVRNVYRKLGVNTRADAVREARRLRLLRP
jgi:LuxR family maltose regulon positive regulatory protein